MVETTVVAPCVAVDPSDLAVERPHCLDHSRLTKRNGRHIKPRQRPQSRSIQHALQTKSRERAATNTNVLPEYRHGPVQNRHNGSDDQTDAEINRDDVFSSRSSVCHRSTAPSIPHGALLPVSEGLRIDTFEWNEHPVSMNLGNHCKYKGISRVRLTAEICMSVQICLAEDV